MNSLRVRKSGIFYLKSKFFIIRLLTYFSFLLIPILSQKSGDLPFIFSALAGVLYTLFMMGQWFFLGKEIDHRLKIYFRVNSSMDRVIYRLFLGMFFFILYFNVLYLFPHKWVNNLFWATWVVLGLFYSWPTRGKIIRESVTSNFSEFRYLDSFEKTVVSLTVVMFFISIPVLPNITNLKAMVVYYDSGHAISNIYWNFLTVNYYPFIKYKELFSMGWAFHFYFVNMSLFLLSFYALLRFFLCRRLALLGVFSLISSWSWTKILVANYGDTLLCTYSLLWVWTILWVVKSSTYRSGLFLGLVSFFGTLIRAEWLILWIPQIFFVLTFLDNKSLWYKRQMLKYASLGFFLSLFVFTNSVASFGLPVATSEAYVQMIIRLFSRKAFYALSPLGLILVTYYMLDKKEILSKWLKLDHQYLKIISVASSTLIVFEYFYPTGLMSNYSLMWTMGLLSLLPLELIFQIMSRLRSSRNMIYLIYILICLLDSHFEGRLKILFKIIESMSV